jgi:hypothetical protein
MAEGTVLLTRFATDPDPTAPMTAPTLKRPLMADWRVVLMVHTPAASHSPKRRWYEAMLNRPETSELPQPGLSVSVHEQTPFAG